MTRMVQENSSCKKGKGQYTIVERGRTGLKMEKLTLDRSRNTSPIVEEGRQG